MNKLLFLGKGVLLLCLFATHFVQAQTVSTAYATQINATFANLDKTKIPHKLLVDYAMEFEELSAYNGTLTTQNLVNAGNYKGIYNTLIMARVQSNVAGLVNPTTFKNNWNNLRQANKIVLSGLYFKYNEFKPDAPNNTITITNGKLYDKYVNGVWQNPYNEKQVFAIASPIVKYNSLTMQVQLPSSLWYTNQGSSVQSIAIDFNDGLGYQPTTFGQIKTVTYSTAGIKEWKYKLTLTNGQILYSHSKLFIDAEIQPANNNILKRTISQPCSQDAFGIDKVEFYGTRPYSGSANQAILEIDYAANDCVIRKPLFVVEGFDSGLFGVENELGEVAYRNFRNSIFREPSNLPAQLNTYDIIYINFKNGKDYMQRNAYLVQDIIKWVNTIKQGSLPNVVLGQSMGGVIGRYALRDMENRGEAHQTNLYISHDAPHQGANMPIAIQYFARHLADQFVSTPVGDMNINVSGNGGAVTIEDMQDLLDAPGTKQLLANYISSGFSLNNSVGDSFRTELRNLGYPQQTRNISLSNGNHCAIPQNFNPSDELFSLTGNAQTKLLTDLVLWLTPLGTYSSITLAVLFNEPGLLIGILPGNSKFDINFNGKALPSAGSTSQIYKGRIAFTKTLFKLFGWAPKITVTLTDRSYNNPVNLSYDYYPGGKYQSFVSNGGQSASNILISYGINMQARENFNFIPTPSALDVGNGNVTLNNNDFLAKYNAITPPTGTRAIPFNNFTTSHNTTGINENHISFNRRNGNWLALELDNVANNEDNFSCIFVCGSKISGADVLCNSSTYSVPTGASVYNWSITQGANLVTLTGNGTPNITLTALTNASGAVTLSLTMGDNGAKCGNVTITKTIWVGKPNTNAVAEQEETCIFSYRAKDYPNTNSYATYNWQYISGTGNASSSNFYTSADYVQFTACPPFSITMKLSSTNSCGTEIKYVDLWLNNEDEEIYRINSSNNNLDMYQNIYTIYPNPAKDIINIEIRDPKNQPQKDSSTSGELFDLMGYSKSKVEITNNKATFSVSGLNKGIYVLKIYINNQVESHQIAVE